jgi:predicted acetyltransferase
MVEGEVFTFAKLMPATFEQQPILANLLELYVHDFSEFHAVTVRPDGRFGYPNLPLYWSEPGRHPFLIVVQGQFAGFVLVNKASRTSSNDSTWDMAEFFVLRGYRRRGIGIEMAHAAWIRFPGPWQVRVMRSNRAAYLFWERAIKAFGVESRHFDHVADNGETWDVFSFESAGAANGGEVGSS